MCTQAVGQSDGTCMTNWEALGTHNCVDATKILEDEKHMPDEQPPLNLRVAHGSPNWVKEAFRKGVNALFHKCNLFQNVPVGRVEIAKPAEVS